MTNVQRPHNFCLATCKPGLMFVTVTIFLFIEYEKGNSRVIGVGILKMKNFNSSI